MTLMEAVEAFKIDTKSLIVHVIRFDPPDRMKCRWKDIKASVLSTRFTELFWDGGNVMYISVPDGSEL